jgi:hypothetical protein
MAREGVTASSAGSLRGGACATVSQGEVVARGGEFVAVGGGFLKASDPRGLGHEEAFVASPSAR